jgi:hypothetical protein
MQTIFQFINLSFTLKINSQKYFSYPTSRPISLTLNSLDIINQPQIVSLTHFFAACLFKEDKLDIIAALERRGINHSGVVGQKWHKTAFKSN